MPRRSANSRPWATSPSSARRSTARGATSNGRSRTASFTCFNAAPSPPARNAAAAPPPPGKIRVAALQRVDLFTGMDRRQTEQIARLLKERRFREGRNRHHGGIRRSGASSLSTPGNATVSSKGAELATLGPGDYFGELALIDGGPRSATVTAATDLVCYGLTFWEFRPLVERNGAIGWKLLEVLARRLRDAAARGQ